MKHPGKRWWEYEESSRGEGQGNGEGQIEEVLSTKDMETNMTWRQEQPPRMAAPWGRGSLHITVSLAFKQIPVT